MRYSQKRKLKESLIHIGYILATLLVIGMMVYSIWYSTEVAKDQHEEMREIMERCLGGSTEDCRNCSTWEWNPTWSEDCRDMLAREKFGR